MNKAVASGDDEEIAFYFFYKFIAKTINHSIEKFKTRYIVVTFTTDGVVSTMVKTACWDVGLQHFVRLDEWKTKSTWLMGPLTKVLVLMLKLLL